MCRRLKTKLGLILKGYSVENQFNVDEIGFLLNLQLLTKSVIEKNEKCSVGKLTMKILSMLFCCWSTGENLKHLIIGNDAESEDSDKELKKCLNQISSMSLNEALF